MGGGTGGEKGEKEEKKGKQGGSGTEHARVPSWAMHHIEIVPH